MPFELLVLLILPAVLAGFIAGVFGLGGGVVIVPAVYYVLVRLGTSGELAMSMAIATSMLAIVVTGFSSAVSHYRLRQVDGAVLRRWLVPLVLGAVVGSTLVARYRTPSLIVFFGAFLWLVALLNVLVQRQAVVSISVARGLVPGWTAVLVLFIGCVSTLAGVGGGTMSVPLLKSLGRRTHLAIGTSAAMGFVLALVASLWMLLFSVVDAGRPAGAFGLVYLPALVAILPCTLVFAPLGAKLGRRIPARWLDGLFVGLLLLVGLRMLVSGLSAFGN
ncbi:MAG TPA: sulfite exporter TauE/SafE family protein [Marinagarivorans sp.]